jgi:hypothetical protein
MVTATAAKIFAPTGVSESDTEGYKRDPTGIDISGTIKDNLIVTGIDSIGTEITTISPADYSLSKVEPVSIIGTGQEAAVVLTVPGEKTSSGKARSLPFFVYIKSDDKGLSSLSLSADNTPVAVSPVYVAGTLVGYEAELTAPSTAGLPAALTVTAVKADPGATLTLVNNGTASHSFSSSKTVIPVTVTAEDKTSATYSVTVYTIPAAPVGFDETDVGYNGSDPFELTITSSSSSSFQINGAQLYDISVADYIFDYFSWGWVTPDNPSVTSEFACEFEKNDLFAIVHQYLTDVERGCTIWIRGRTDDGKTGEWSHQVVFDL